ncbi:HAD-IIB family hydrolase [Mycoplasmopsis glycophila]|uniref:COF family HAD hydrolase protein n=1 Tax=Mycoplasmopsis glycophila TaxID=171285 RepID=A0A449AUB0_9BACT|nr:HAD family hydrolase [Mycoplasmopsis glycophila]VEU70060.1 COF family HAD hydrolase protein [Mycoplasmopsis glycophila]
MRKIFAYDLDGTLLLKDNTVHPFTKAALDEVHKKGGLNVVATGRGFKKVIPLIESGELSNIDYFVCSNGAAIYNRLENKVILLKELKKEAFEVMKKTAQKYQSILTLDTTTYNGTFLPNGKFPDWMSQEQIMDLNVLNLASLEEIQNIINDPETKITQIALRNPANLAVKITNEVREQLNPNDFEIYLTNSIYTDANPKGASKWNGLKALLDMLNESSSNLIAFGDSGNDVDMLKNASIGISLGNGTKESKEAANYVIGDHQTGTIGETLLKIINEQKI